MLPRLCWAGGFKPNLLTVLFTCSEEEEEEEEKTTTKISITPVLFGILYDYYDPLRNLSLLGDDGGKAFVRRTWIMTMVQYL